MALSVAAIKAVIKEKKEAAFGEPDDAGIADDAYQADAEVLFEALTTLATTVLNDGADSGGDTLTDLTGTIV